MLNKKIVKTLSIIAVVASFVSVVGSTDASAKTYKSKVFAAKQLSQHKFKKSYTKYTRGGLIYTTRSLKHWNHKGANYPRTKWTTNQSVTVKKSDGKKAVYYYIKNKNNGIKGWIWRGYLKNTPAKVSATPKKLATAKKVTGIKKSMSTKTVLSKTVSNSNANGFTQMNTVRKGLQKWYTLLQNPNQFTYPADAKNSFEADYQVYKDIVTNNNKNVRSMDAAQIKELLEDINYYTTTALK